MVRNSAASEVPPPFCCCLIYSLAASVSPQSYLQDPDEGIQLHISPRHNKSFQQVLSIIVSLEKLKKKVVPCPLAFQDGGLRTFFSLIFEEGTS